MSQNNAGIELAGDNFKYEVVSQSDAIKTSILPRTKQNEKPKAFSETIFLMTYSWLPAAC